MKRRVVITGLGTINAIGQNVAETWAALLAGTSGVSTITRFDATPLSCQIAAELKNYSITDHFDPKEARRLDPYTQYAMIAAREAVKDAGITPEAFDLNRVGVIFAAGIGGQQTFEEEALNMFQRGPSRISPFFIPKMISNIGAAHIAIEWKLKGINFNCVSACSSAMHALGTAFRTIQYGDADAIVSGGAEAAITPLSVGGFCSLKALSTRNDDPAHASRPFDRDRSGFVMGEGSGVLVLEELEHALARGAHIYAELVGYGATCDAFHVTAPVESGEGEARAMQIAMNDAGIQPHEIDYINAHGTSTELNDKIETVAFKTVFGEHAYKLKISSTKSMVGHTLGAAGGIESIACIKAIETGIIHPTINLEFPDPDCDLDYTPNQPAQMPVRYALNNSLGFGGHNGALVFKRYEG
jgi:3-oxoacyl-[acyl-carrier-protein] synthase II